MPTSKDGSGGARRGDRGGVSPVRGRRARARLERPAGRAAGGDPGARAVQRLFRSLENRGVSPDQYFQLTGQSPEEISQQVTLEAAQSVARELALEALAEKAGIEVSDEDVKELVREQAAAAGDDADDVIEDIWAHGHQETLREDLRLRAALDRLAADVKPIAPELHEAREAIWTPDKEKPATETKLWTPGS